MIRKLAIGFATIMCCAGFLACNSSVEPIQSTSSCAAVRTFSFQPDKKIMPRLDSVFFSIDLVTGRIFNAEPMPYGTDVTRLVPVLTTLEGVSSATFTVTRAGMADTVYNYVTSMTDSIDFTNPVRLTLVSLDGLVTRDYTIYVNVHKEKADSLTWSQVDRRTLPTSLGIVSGQRTVRFGNSLRCLTTARGKYCMASLENDINDLNGATADLGQWDLRDVNFGFAPQISSFAATDDALYILNEEGELYRSTDGQAWTSTSLQWHSIYGAYGKTLLGSVQTADGWKIQTYPSGETTDLPQGMPVAKTSVPVIYNFQMSDVPQMLIVGGRKADGSLSTDTWGYDGRTWMKISRRGLPEGLLTPAVAPYFMLEYNKDWTSDMIPSLIAIGGQKADGTVSRKVYISDDYGITWNEASDLLQLPTYIPSLYDAQMFTISRILTGDILPARISRPIEKWDCPYIYMFGGVLEDGQTSNNVWRGVINQFSYKPVM